MKIFHWGLIFIVQFIITFQLQWLPKQCIRQYVQRKNAARVREDRKTSLREKLIKKKLKEKSLPSDVLDDQS